jgi:tetratricopeptide (TPR) repeat protein
MRLAFFAAAFTMIAFGQNQAPLWEVEVRAGKTAFAFGNYAMAVQRYQEALKQAEGAGASEEALSPILQALAIALRTDNRAPEAQQVLERLLAVTRQVHGPHGSATANVLSDIALVQRSLDLRKEAAITISEAIEVRLRQPQSVTTEVARDVTLAGTLQREMGEAEPAKNFYVQAVSLWGSLPESGLMILTALDPLAALYRDESAYAEAEILYNRALRVREAVVGPKDAELIGTLDSLAYVLFGLKKYAEAEEAYKRLLAIWELSGGPDHPMVALTLDKMAVFYIEQKRFEDADSVASRALSIRAQAVIDSSQRAARTLAGQRKVDEAVDLYERTLRAASDLRVGDDAKPVMIALREYSVFLRDNQKDARADAIGRRLLEVLQSTGKVQVSAPKPVPSGAKKLPPKSTR